MGHDHYILYLIRLTFVDECNSLYWWSLFTLGYCTSCGYLCCMEMHVCLSWLSLGLFGYVYGNT